MNEEVSLSTELSREVAEEGELWSARARDWAEVQERFLDPCYSRVLECMGVGEGHAVLDVGCGAGRFLELAALKGAKVAGLDAAPGMIEITRARIPGGNLYLGDMESLPFDGRTFDFVTGFNSFSHAGDPVRALTEAARVVMAEGRVAVTVWGKAAPGSMRDIASRIILSIFSDDQDAQPAEETTGAGEDIGAAEKTEDEAHFHSISSEDDLEALVRQAGLTPVDEGEVQCEFVYPDEATLVKGLMSPGPFVAAARRAGEDELRGKIVKAMEEFKTGAGGFSFSNTFRYLIASL